MKHKHGRLEVICGCMFSGKTEELIRRVKRAIIAKQHVQVFKPELDYRYSLAHVSDHNHQQVEATPVEWAVQILDQLKDNTTVIAIDEAQFFGADIVGVVKELINRGIRVIVAGLDTDFRGEPFGFMPILLTIADNAQKLHAICMVCGDDASRTQRLINGQPAKYDDQIILVGASEAYEARCRDHHIVPKQ